MNTENISDFQPADLTSASIQAAIGLITTRLGELEVATVVLDELVTKNLLTASTKEIAALEEQQRFHSIDIRRLTALRSALVDQLGESLRNEKIGELRDSGVKAQAAADEVQRLTPAALEASAHLLAYMEARQRAEHLRLVYVGACSALPRASYDVQPPLPNVSLVEFGRERPGSYQIGLTGLMDLPAPIGASGRILWAPIL